MNCSNLAETGDTLIQLAYEALERGTAWQELLDGIVAATGRTLGLLSLAYPEHPVLSFELSTGAPQEAFREYAERWKEHDALAMRVDWFGVPPGKLLLSHEICPDEVLEATEYYRQFLLRYRWHYGAIVRLSSHARQVAFLSLSGPKESGPLNGRSIELLNRVIPHICRAVRVHESLADQRHESAAAAESAKRPEDGVLLTTFKGQVLYSNPAAARILTRADGLRLRGAAVAAIDPDDHALLQRAIRNAAQNQNGAHSAPARLPIRRRAGGLPYLAVVQPASPASPSPMSLTPPTALLTLIDPGQPAAAVDAGVLRQLFQLTAAEARLVQQLVSGLTPKGAALASGITISTVRTQLRSAFAKTGCSRQSELVHLARRFNLSNA